MGWEGVHRACRQTASVRTWRASRTGWMQGGTWVEGGQCRPLSGRRLKGLPTSGPGTKTALPMQGAHVRSLVREEGPTCHN